jgi:membrane associated rhomboid family serine protease
MAQPAVPPETPVCYRHPDRRAGVSCQRCDRPICPDCMVQASVGFQCPECAKQGARNSPVITPRSLHFRPVVTQALIGLNALAFVLDIVSGGSLSGSSGSFAADWGLIGGIRFRFGGGGIGVAFGEWYRLVTGGFVHAGLVHIGMNMLVLWLLGSQVERLLGHARFAALYLASLLAGAFAVMLANPTELTVGASGAIFGLMGAAVAFQRSQRINLMQSGLGGLIILNLVITFAIPGISIAGHIGGLIGGFVTGWVLFQLDRKFRSEWVGVAVALALAGLFLLGGIWAAGQYASPVVKF